MLLKERDALRERLLTSLAPSSDPNAQDFAGFSSTGEVSNGDLRAVRDALDHLQIDTVAARSALDTDAQ